MTDTAKLMQLLTDINNIEDFIKVSGINLQITNEILRLINEAKTRALK